MDGRKEGEPVGHRGCCHDDSGEAGANGCAAVPVCLSIGRLLIQTANHREDLTHLLSHTPAHTCADTSAAAHAGVCKASQWETVCVSVSLSGTVINNAWLWEDERLFWLEACVSYGARDIGACNFNYTSEGARRANAPLTRAHG